MKHNFKIFTAVALLGVLAISSCTKKIDDAYKNPNAAVRQPVEVILPSMIGTMLGNGSGAANSFGLGGDIINVGRYIQYWGSYTTSTADNSGPSFDKMSGVTGSGTSTINIWGMYYFSQGANLNRIIDYGNEEQKWDFVGAAWALRAWGMLELTNQYGEAILRQAFNSSLQQFSYEDQSEFYDSVRVTCHRALNYLNATGGAMDPAKFAASDFYFNKGDLGKWKKFVYGVLARSFAYIHNKSSYSADSVIKYANLSCITNADNNMLSFQNTGVSATKNYFGATRANVNGATSGIRQSNYIASLMSGTNPLAFTGVFDPRAWYILRENKNGTFKGFTPNYNSTINTTPIGVGDSSTSFLGTRYAFTGSTSPDSGRYVFRDNADVPVMTASEMQLVAAEAYLRKGLTTESRNAYINAISLNFDMLVEKYSSPFIPTANVIDAAKKAAYLADPNIVPPTPAGMTLTRIMLQKYIALYVWGAHETWADMRRYHYSVDIDPKTGSPVYAGFVIPTGANLWAGPNGTGSNNGKPVQRVRPSYNSEYLYNIPSLTSVGAYPPGNDYHTKEMWFSKQ